MNEMTLQGSTSYVPRTGSTSTYQIRDTSVPAPAEGRKDLEKLFGKDFISKIDKKQEAEVEITVDTDCGPVKMKALYRPQYNDIILTVSDTQTTGTTLRIDLNPNGQPKNLASIDDPDKLFGGLLQKAGNGYLAKLIGLPAKENFQKRVQALKNYEKVTKYLQQAQGDSSRRIPLNNIFTGPKGIFVPQNYFQVAPLSTPLATSGVNTCAALVIIDKKNNKHYLAHIDPSASPDQILQSIRNSGIDLFNCEIYVMEGMTPSGTVQNIFSALITLRVGDKTKFVSFGGSGFPGITSYNGELFLDPPVDYFSEKAKNHI